MEHDPTFRAVLHNGPYSLHFNACPAPDYDAFGVVDLTFGPGRFLQLSPARSHLESGRLLNLMGVAGNSVSDLALIGRMEGDLTASPGARSERQRKPLPGTTALRVEKEGVYIEETTPGLEDPKSPDPISSRPGHRHRHGDEGGVG